MTLARVPATEPLRSILSILQADGGLIIEGMFGRHVIQRMSDAIDERASAFAPGTATQGLDEDGRAFVGTNTVRFSSLGKISPAYFEMLDNPIFEAIADAALLPACGSYWVNTAQAMLIGPGSSAQMLHRDADNWPLASMLEWPEGPELIVSAMIALDEVTEDLGATRVIPGSHRWSDRGNLGSAEQTVPAPLSPGDALVYTGKVIHGGGANRTTSQWRRAMHLSFVVGWLTPEESSPLDFTDQELGDQSPRVQRLLGHRSYDPRPHRGGGLWLRNVRKIEDDG